MITIKELTVAYGGKHLIIERLSLSMKSGRIHGLVGLNGAGKTTLLNTMHGMIKPKTGSIKFHGAPLGKNHIGFLPTENYFYPNITGREYLDLFSNAHFNIKEWNDLFKLPLDQVIDGYSTGMKKKLAILSVLKLDQPIMILDEPFNGLDLETVRTLHSILLALKSKQKTIIITSHILDSLTDLSDEIHYLEGGKMKSIKDKAHFEPFKTELYESLAKKTEKRVEALLS